MTISVPDLSDTDKRRAWALVQAHLAPSLGKGIRIHDLGRNNAWYASRAGDTLDDFVCSWDQLLNRSTFGPKKVDLLLTILIEAVEHHIGRPLDLDDGVDSPTPLAEQSDVAATDPVARLDELGIPAAFPLRLSQFSSRVVNFCESNHISTIGALIHLLHTDGEAGLLKRDNLGRKSVDEIVGFCTAVQDRRAADVARYVPYDPDRRTLSLPAALNLAIGGSEPDVLRILTRRLVENQTLDDSGVGAGISRERVRQIEAQFLQQIAAALDWFSSDRSVLFSRLESGEPIDDILLAVAPANQALAVRAVDAVFRDSPEGRAIRERKLQAFAALAEEIQSLQSFYFGSLQLHPFLAAKGYTDRVAQDFASYGEQRRLFMHEKASDSLSPIGVTLKRVAATILKQSEAGLTDSELVDQLHRVPDLRHVTREGVRRNFSVWRTDPDFPADRIRHSEGSFSTSLRDAREFVREVAKVRARTPQTAGQTSLLDETEPAALHHSNLAIAEIAGASATPTILGLLPLSPEQQTKTVQAVIEQHQKQFRRLLRLLELYPAATSYAVAYAAGTEMDAAAFYEAVERGLSITIPANQRNELAAGFQRAVRTAGLLEADVRPSDYLWPILFQAGVVPQFVPQLGTHIRIFLERNPPPDYEDQAELERFAEAVHDRVPQGSRRLRRILESKSGLRICAAILEAHRADNFDLLPPHLRATIREAFAGIESRSFFATPHLQFNRDLEQVELHLPRQTRKILQPSSCWQLSSGRTAPADEATTIAVDELPEDVVVNLRHVRPPFTDWSRRIDTKPTRSSPTQVFRMPRGKLIHVNNAAETRLPFGEYVVVANADTSSNIEEGWAPCGENRKWIDYASFPGQLALQINAEGSLCTFSPRDEPAILIVAKGGGHLPTTGEEQIYFGEGLQVSVHVPASELADGVNHELSISDGMGTVSQSTVFDAADFHDQNDVEDPELTANALARLPAGLHHLTVTLKSSRRSVRRQVYFWKGFKHTEQGFGFVCATPVGNVDAARSSGIRAHARGLAVVANWAEPNVAIALQQPSTVLTLAKPGIAFGLLNPSGGPLEYRPLGQLYEFGPDDMSRLVIEFNQVGEWKLLAGHTVIRTFPRGCGTFTQRVQAFFQEFGEATAIYAESLGKTRVHVLTVTRLTLAQDFRLAMNPGSNSYSCDFKISDVQAQLGVACHDFVAPDSTKPLITIAELLPGEMSLDVSPLGFVGLQIEHTGSCYHVRFHVDQRAMRQGGYELDFVCRKHESDEWTSLRVAELQGICGTRILLIPEPFAPAPRSLFEDLLSKTWRNFDEGDVPPEPLDFSLSPSELTLCFERFQGIFDYHYSSAGWSSVRWLRIAFGRLCKEAAAGTPAQLAPFAVRGLAEKAGDTAALFRPLVFGDQPDLWALTPEAFKSDGYGADCVGQSFEALAALADCASLNDFLAQRDDVDAFVLGSFRPAAGGGYNYDFGHFARELVKALAEYDDDQAGQPLLLGVGYFARALHKLRRNTEALIRQRDPHQPDQPARQQSISSILALHSRLPVVAGFVRNKLRVQNCELDLDVYAPMPGPEIRQLVLTLTALARLRSFGKINGLEYKQHLSHIFAAPPGDPRNIQKGATLLIDLAPELFACGLLFWEVILFEQR